MIDRMTQTLVLPSDTKESFVMVLPKPPSINHYYGNASRGRKFIKPEGLQYRSAVQRHVDIMEIEKLDGDLYMQVCFYPPDKRKRDLDNILKALQDAITKTGIIEDDSKIKWNLSVMMQEIVKDGLVVVTFGRL